MRLITPVTQVLLAGAIIAAVEGTSALAYVLVTVGFVLEVLITAVIAQSDE